MNIIKFRNIPIALGVFAVAMVLTIEATAQNKKNSIPAKSTATDTTKKVVDPISLTKQLTSPKPYKEIVPGTAKTINSFIKIHFVNDRYLFELSDSLFNRDLLLVTRLEKGPVDFQGPGFGYSGDETAEAVIRFERILGNKIAMRSISFTQFANDTTANGLAHSLVNNNNQLIQGIFPIKAINPANKNAVIDITDFFNGDNGIITLDGSLAKLGTANMIADKSYLDEILGFPGNIEIRAVKTYNRKPLPGLTPPPNTYEFNTSLVLLPKIPMRQRLADPRIGFFSNSYKDFDANPHGVAKTDYIWRWRMEPKPEDMARYNRGELVEPQHPIVIYIDPATPKKWVSYLIAGINDWQVAFEKAGFKNAIMGKEAPINDSTWRIQDARHNVIIYKPSEIENAAGYSVKDPRTGEILETHISWYHNVMNVLQNWYTIQAGAIDPRAQKPELDDELMGQLIRFVSSHEIGHTLGLMHNFGASSTVPVANLRNKAWVEAHGHTPSIMDYARFNYVAQPEDHISEKGIFPRIGDYDKWAIEWGYRLLPEAHSAEEERPILNKLTITKLASGKQYFYGSQVDPYDNSITALTSDPRSQNEDLGDDAMLAGMYGIKNLKRIEPNILKWTKTPNKNYDKADALYTALVNQFSLYMGHVLKNVGGMYTTPKTTEQIGSVFELEKKEKQRRAMSFLIKELFETPSWLIDDKLYLLGRSSFDQVKKVQQRVLGSLLNGGNLMKLTLQEENFPGQSYRTEEVLSDLKKGVFSELSTGKPITLYRRELQKTYVDCLVAMISKPAVGNSDATSIVKAHSRELSALIKISIQQRHIFVERAHLMDIYDRLQQALNPNKSAK
jgi:hypothetical protein